MFVLEKMSLLFRICIFEFTTASKTDVAIRSNIMLHMLSALKFVWF